MSRNSEGPKCPTPAEVDQLVDVCNSCITMVEKSGLPDKESIKPQLERLIEVLDWAGEQVNKRRLYSKKFQLKDKERTRLLKERLGEQYDDILQEAKAKASDRLFEEVANGEPDKDDDSLLS